MNIDTYLYDPTIGIAINDVINLGNEREKEKRLFRKVEKEIKYDYHIIINIESELITLFIRTKYTSRISFCTRKELKEYLDDAAHTLVTRPRIVKDRVEVETLIDVRKEENAQT